MTILNIAAYKFLDLSQKNLQSMRENLKQTARSLGVKGTILLSPEGFNLYLAAERNIISKFKQILLQHLPINDVTFKESYSDTIPFSRMLVKLKKEIIAFGEDDIEPAKTTAPHLAPEAFKKMYQENQDMIVLDTRNDYEIKLGTFKDAIDFNIKNFRDFKDKLNEIDHLKDKTIVTFCTGGIRCEKAAAFMQNHGFTNVFQLDGGILNYFEKCGKEFYEGECFVFDKRVSLDQTLQETPAIQCYECRSPLTAAEQASCNAVCPYCGKNVPQLVVGN
jgi:UPF0176 protein